MENPIIRSKWDVRNALAHGGEIDRYLALRSYGFPAEHAFTARHIQRYTAKYYYPKLAREWTRPWQWQKHTVRSISQNMFREHMSRSQKYTRTAHGDDYYKTAVLQGPSRKEGRMFYPAIIDSCDESYYIMLVEPVVCKCQWTDMEGYMNTSVEICACPEEAEQIAIDLAVKAAEEELEEDHARDEAVVSCLHADDQRESVQSAIAKLRDDPDSERARRRLEHEWTVYREKISERTRALDMARSLYSISYEDVRP